MIGSQTATTTTATINDGGEMLTNDSNAESGAIEKLLKRIILLLTAFTDIQIENEDVE